MTSFVGDQNERLCSTRNGSSAPFPGQLPPHPAVATVAFSTPYHSPPHSLPEHEATSPCPSPPPAPAQGSAFGAVPAAYPIQPACLFSHHDFARILGGATGASHHRPLQGPAPCPENFGSQFSGGEPHAQPLVYLQGGGEGRSPPPSRMLNGQGPCTRLTDKRESTEDDAPRDTAAVPCSQEEDKGAVKAGRAFHEKRRKEQSKTSDIHTDDSTAGSGTSAEQVAMVSTRPHRSPLRNRHGRRGTQPRRQAEPKDDASGGSVPAGPRSNRGDHSKRSVDGHRYARPPHCHDQTESQDEPQSGGDLVSSRTQGVSLRSQSSQVANGVPAKERVVVSLTSQRGERPPVLAGSQLNPGTAEFGGGTGTEGALAYGQLASNPPHDAHPLAQCGSKSNREHPDTFPSLLASARHHAFSNPPSPNYREVPASAPPAAASALTRMSSNIPDQPGWNFASQEVMGGTARSSTSSMVADSGYHPASGISAVGSAPASATTGGRATATAFFSDRTSVQRPLALAVSQSRHSSNVVEGSLGNPEGDTAARHHTEEGQSRIFSFAQAPGGSGEGGGFRELSLLQARLEGQDKSGTLTASLARVELSGQQRANSRGDGGGFLGTEQGAMRDSLTTRRSIHEAASWLVPREVSPLQPTGPQHAGLSQGASSYLASQDPPVQRFSPSSRTGGHPRSFRLFAWHRRQQLLVRSPEELAKCLGCSRQSKAKVVAIFGNTGDGKSVLLNKLFFSGQPVFPLNPPASLAGSPSLATSTGDRAAWPGSVASNKGRLAPEKESCPPDFGGALRGSPGVGEESRADGCSGGQGRGTLVAGLGGTKDVWVSWWRAEPYSGCDDAIVMDTEGLLGVCADEASRLRMLMIVLALADICIVCKSSERLTVDLFQFLNAASNIYLQHLRPSLREASELQAVPAHPNGPACLIYHQLLYDKPLMTRTTLAAARASDVFPSSFSHPTARGSPAQSAATPVGGGLGVSNGHSGRTIHGFLGTGEERQRGWLTVMDSSTFLELFNAAFSTALPPSSTPSATPFEAFSLVEYIGFSPCFSPASNCAQPGHLPVQGHSVSNCSLSPPVEIEALSQRIRQLLHRSTAARPARPLHVIFGLLQHLVRQFGRHRVQLQRSFHGTSASVPAATQKRPDSKLRPRAGSRKDGEAGLSGSGGTGAELSGASATDADADSIVIRWGSAPASISAARGEDEEEENAVLLTQLCRRYYRDDGMESCVVCPAICLCCGRRCSLSMNHKGVPHCAAMRDDTAAAVAADLLRRAYGRATVGSVDGCQGPLESGSRGSGVGRVRPQGGGVVQSQPAGCRYRRELQNRRMLCRECWEQRGREEVVEWRSCPAADASSLKGMVMQMFSGAGVLECRVCGVIYMKREGVLKANPQTPIEAGKVIVQTHHCWSHTPLSATAGGGKEAGMSSGSEGDDCESTDGSGDEQPARRRDTSGPLFFSSGKYYFSSSVDELDVNCLSKARSAQINGRQSELSAGGDSEASMRWRLSYYKRLAPILAQRPALGEGRKGLLASNTACPLGGASSNSDMYSDCGFQNSTYADSRAATSSVTNCLTGYVRSGTSSSFFAETSRREAAFLGSPPVPTGSEDGFRPAHAADPRATANSPLSFAGEWLAAGRDQLTTSTGMAGGAAFTSVAMAAAQTATSTVTSIAQKSIAGLPSHWTGQGPAFSRKQALSLFPAAFARRFSDESDSTPSAGVFSGTPNGAQGVGNSRGSNYMEEPLHPGDRSRQPQHALNDSVSHARTYGETDFTPRAASRVSPSSLRTRPGLGRLPEFGERPLHPALDGGRRDFDDAPPSFPVHSFRADLPFRTSRRCSLADTDFGEDESRSEVRAEEKATDFSPPGVDALLKVSETDQCDDTPSVDNSRISDFSWGGDSKAEVPQLARDVMPQKVHSAFPQPANGHEQHARDQTTAGEGDREQSPALAPAGAGDTPGVSTLSSGCKKDLRVRIRIPLTVEERIKRREQLHGEKAKVKGQGRHDEGKSDSRCSGTGFQSASTRHVSHGFQSSDPVEDGDCKALREPPQMEGFSSVKRTNMLLQECQSSPVPPPHEKLLLLQNAGHSFAFPQVIGNGFSAGFITSEKGRNAPLRSVSGEFLGGTATPAAALKDTREAKPDLAEAEIGSASNCAVGSLGSRTNSLGIPRESAKEQPLAGANPTSLACDFAGDGSSLVALSAGPAQEEDPLYGELPAQDRGDAEGQATSGRGKGGPEYRLLIRTKAPRKTVRKIDQAEDAGEE